VTAPRTPRPELFVFAFDHRDPLFELARATHADEGRIAALKQLFVQAVAETEAARGLAGHVGLLCDDRYGQGALNAATGRGWWLGRPVEWPGSNPVVFEHGRSIGTTLVSWPIEHVVKCLVRFHPDDDIETRLENEAQLRALYDAVQASGHELMLEIVPPAHLPRGPDIVLRALTRLYNLGIVPEWWKLPPPSRNEWPALDALIAQRDPYCRGVVILGLGAPIDELARGFAEAKDSACARGFAVGRTIFGEPARAWLAGAIDDAGLVAAVRTNYEALIDAWVEAREGR
jgi:5-dehydro-2-deoxygluconokinase